MNPLSEAEQIRKLANTLEDIQQQGGPVINIQQLLPGRFRSLDTDAVRGDPINGPAKVEFTDARAQRDYEFEYIANRYHSPAGTAQMQRGDSILYVYVGFTDIRWNETRSGSELTGYNLEFQVDLGDDPYTVSKQTMAEMLGGADNLDALVSTAEDALDNAAEAD
jgi:hypothetical protein